MEQTIELSTDSKFENHDLDEMPLKNLFELLDQDELKSILTPVMKEKLKGKKKESTKMQDSSAEETSLSLDEKKKKEKKKGKQNA